MSVVTAADATRRHALLIGTSRYQPGWSDISDGVLDELRKLRRLLVTTFRYDSCREVLNATADDLSTAVVDWIRTPEIREDDLVVIYYTGHGVAQGSQLRLVTTNTRTDAPNTAPSASDLANWIWGGPEGLRCRHVLLIIDTCSSGAGSFNALQIANEIREAAGGKARGGEFHVVAAARSIERATVGHFVDALCRVIDAGQVVAPDEEWLRPDALINRVNTDPAFRSGSQHADITGRGEGYFRFFPNPAWDPRLRVSMDRGQRQRALHRIQELADRTHWNPRARGVSVSAEQGSFFVGRTRALHELGTWAATAAHGAARVVVGRPGSGKSALLARFAASGGRPAVDVAIHSRAKTASGVLLEMAFTLDLSIPATATEEDLPKVILDALRARSDRALVVIDALDEAEHPAVVAMTLRFLLDGAPPLVFIVGVRQGGQQVDRLVKQLGTRAATLDLDSDEYWEPQDVHKYVCTYLAHADGSPYRSEYDGGLREEIARAVARRAGRSFLVASTTVHTLVRSAARIGHSDLEKLPSSAGEAFDQDLRRFPAVARDRGRAVLSALAFAEGRGLPRALWARVAAALGNVVLDESDIDIWLDAADFFIVADEDAGTPVYRLYHDEFARHLRVLPEGAGVSAVEDRYEVVTQALAHAVGNEPVDWFTADSYLQQYMCVHAAKGRLLEQFTDDPGFLSGSDPTRLLNTLRRARTGSSKKVEQAYRLLTLAYHQIRHAMRPSDRASQLQLAARQLKYEQLADRFAATLPLPWLTAWAQMPADLSLTLARLGSLADVDVIAMASLEGEQVLAAGHHTTVRIWDVATGIERQPLEHRSYVGSLVTLELDDSVILISGDSQGFVTCWDLRTGVVKGSVTFGELGSVRVVARLVDGVPIVVAAQSDSLLLWHLADGSIIRENRTQTRGSSIRSVAIGEGPVPSVLVGRDDGVIEVLDPRTLEATAPLLGHRDRVTSMATGLHDGASVVISASSGTAESSVRMWDLSARRELRRVDVPSGTRAVAVMGLDGVTPRVVTAADDLAIWNLIDGSLVGRLQGHEGPVRSVLAATIDGSLQLVTGGVDGTIRRWEPGDASEELSEPDPLSAFSAVAVGSIAGEDIIVSARGLGRFERRDTSTGEVIGEFPVVYPRWVYAMGIGRADNTACLAFSGEDEYVRRLDLNSMKFVEPPLKAASKNRDALRPIFKFTLVEDLGVATALAAIGHERKVRRIDLTTGEKVGVPWTFPDQVTGIAAAGRSVVLLTHDRIIVGDFDRSARGRLSPRRELRHRNTGWVAIAAAITGENLFIFAGGWDRTVSLMDGAGDLITSLKLDTVINALALDASGTLVVVGNKGLVALRCSALLGSMPKVGAMSVTD